MCPFRRQTLHPRLIGQLLLRTIRIVGTTNRIDRPAVQQADPIASKSAGTPKLLVDLTDTERLKPGQALG